MAEKKKAGPAAAQKPITPEIPPDQGLWDKVYSDRFTRALEEGRYLNKPEEAAKIAAECANIFLETRKKLSNAKKHSMAEMPETKKA
jgi:hypothetical protein